MTALDIEQRVSDLMSEAESAGFKGITFFYHHMSSQVIVQWIGDDTDPKLKAATESSLVCLFEGLDVNPELLDTSYEDTSYEDTFEHGEQEAHDGPSPVVNGGQENHGGPLPVVNGLQEDHNDASPLVNGGQENPNRPSPAVNGGQENHNGPSPLLDGLQDNHNGPSPVVNGGIDNHDGPLLGVNGGQETHHGASPVVNGGQENHNGLSPVVNGGQKNHNGPSPASNGGQENHNGSSPVVGGRQDNRNGPSPVVNGGLDNHDGPLSGVNGGQENHDGPSRVVNGGPSQVVNGGQGDPKPACTAKEPTKLICDHCRSSTSVSKLAKGFESRRYQASSKHCSVCRVAQSLRQSTNLRKTRTCRENARMSMKCTNKTHNASTLFVSTPKKRTDCELSKTLRNSEAVMRDGVGERARVTIPSELRFLRKSRKNSVPLASLRSAVCNTKKQALLPSACPTNAKIVGSCEPSEMLGSYKYFLRGVEKTKAKTVIAEGRTLRTCRQNSESSSKDRACKSSAAQHITKTSVTAAHKTNAARQRTSIRVVSQKINGRSKNKDTPRRVRKPELKSDSAGMNPYFCQMCRSRFSSATDLKAHLASHTEPRTKRCDLCTKTFKTASHLRVHTRIHTGERPHSCPSCEKCFTTTSQLKIHLRTHTGEKPHRCQTCGKSFSTAGSLTIHLRTHSGEKPFMCEICNRGFTNSGHLRDHMRIHTGERPYPCSLCFKSFMRSTHLKIHLKAKH